MKATVAALLVLLPVSVLAAEGVLPCEVMSLSVGALERGPFGYNSGKLPWSTSALSSGPDEWTSGTTVLLQVEVPPGSRLLPSGHEILSFVDDTGKNLAKLPEGAVSETHGFPGRDKPLVVVADPSGTKALVALRSLKCPNKGAVLISGEAALCLTSAPDSTVVSAPVAARVGQKATAGSVAIEITQFGRRSQRGSPQGLPTPPPQFQNRNELGIQIHPGSPDAVVTKVEILNGLNKESLGEISGIDASVPNMTYIRSVDPSVSSVMFRVTVADGRTKSKAFVRFSTGLGIYKE